MNDQATKSGWLSWRFWLGSAVFWMLFGGISLGASTLQFLDDGSTPASVGESLELLAWRMAPYWLATPPMFELAWRLGRARLPARRHWGLLLATIVVASLLHTVLLGLGWTGGSLEFGWWFVAMWLPTLIHYAAVLGCAIAVNQYRLNEERRRELLTAQLRVLRAQLQPHFLFNTLQAIASTARQDADTAVRMIALLGDMLRQTLRERDDDLVPLAEEQALLQPYLELQRLRFADRLRIDVELPDEVLGAMVPDLMLQPLVENALFHGIEQRPGAGTVQIRARRRGEQLELQVADDGAGPDGPAIAEGVGLGATRARLQALFGDAAEIELLPSAVRGTVVVVRLPWREAPRAA